ncbi:sigma factor-binding protein Crl [Aeromonas hydrophila]|uniref:sigma factor-binding protein Crl n=1 Tax=Aeromonas hydrophila TaxID=644 RepID=UPI0018609CA1|nr:sigma factor-binding protein Crl [Aeromonas hydrophila]EHA1067064.1 sigma factor-binding protein Crl [Aeromonas hydrophila]EHA1069233.1 sigma factor-binding protein Crl [Aeromonas hydrophila]MBM0437191.1 sigma factor-binding protein Crl [Aeromonas hydrophila subsp. ranae]MBW3828194.1 sigma factor-binding protein Crl [Aeromonas hydrophila]MCX4114072.1 sigma factor-binding protein Crl [Aeromonas hydrophila]
MSERVTYKRLLRQFAAIGPYLREDLCEEGRYRFDCLSVCVSAKPAPDKREFWGWWLVLEQKDHSFSYHYQVGFYNAEGEWLNKPLPKKHQAEVERTLNHFYKLISDKLHQLGCQLAPADQVTNELTVTAA